MSKVVKFPLDGTDHAQENSKSSDDYAKLARGMITRYAQPLMVIQRSL